MNVIMSGIDYSIATLDIREKFSLTTTSLENVYSYILKNNNILGLVIISTCNRTEIYISCNESIFINPFNILCDALCLDFSIYEYLHSTKTGTSAMKHLSELACGVKSQIWGDDQIITQVKNSINKARELKAADSNLEVMFRNAIASAKKVKTLLKLNSRENSVVYKTLNIINKNKDIKKILVIGNGEIGRLMTTVLVENNYHTSITLRQYKYGVSVVPIGANSIDYDLRYENLNKYDVVISATLSPHMTIEFEKLDLNNKIPKIFIDIAVPRDIDPKIKNIKNILFYDMDNICENQINKNHEKQLKEVNKIIEKYIMDYEKWCGYTAGVFEYK